jgi:hypothetical protein
MVGSHVFNFKAVSPEEKALEEAKQAAATAAAGEAALKAAKEAAEAAEQAAVAEAEREGMMQGREGKMQILNLKKTERKKSMMPFPTRKSTFRTFTVQLAKDGFEFDAVADGKKGASLCLEFNKGPASVANATDEHCHELADKDAVLQRGFVLQCGGTSVLVKAASEAERRDWVSAIGYRMNMKCLAESVAAVPPPLVPGVE